MKLSISSKLLIGLSLLIFGLTASVSYFNSEYLKKSILLRERDIHLSQIDSRAKEIDTLFEKNLMTIDYFTKLLLESNSDATSTALLKKFDHQDQIMSLVVYSKKSNKNLMLLTKQDLKYTEAYNRDREQFNQNYLKKVDSNPYEIQSYNISQLYKKHQIIEDKPILTLYIPYAINSKNEVDLVIIADLNLLNIQKIFASEKIGESYFINQDGFSLTGSNPNIIFDSFNYNNEATYKFIHDTQVPQFSGLFHKDNKSILLSAIHTKYNMLLINEVNTDVLLAPVELTLISTYRISGYFLAISLFVLFLFSLTITTPIEKLNSVAIEISKGNFNQHPTQLIKQFFKDEISTLTLTLERMISGLKERDQFRNLFNKFHGSSITEDLLKNEVALRGEKKNVFVFFSDLRGFTQMSENQDPSHVVKMLNEYFSYMVPVINQYGGVVDKFIGDAIMAVWGVPTESADDGYNALMASIKMREALNNLNQVRKNRGDSELWIGMGLHYGEAISGTIGSIERMEYTVIGNTINTASRIEASTKAFGSDLLVSEEVYQNLQGKFIYEFAGAVEVKGRSDKLNLYKVKGYYNSIGEPVEVVTPYSDYQAEAANKVKIVS